LLANTLLVAAVLAAAIHLYVLLQMRERRAGVPVLALHVLLGVLALLPALFLIFPPADSELNMAFWIAHWDFQQLKSAFAIALRSFMPVPAWWEHHVWNTQCQLQVQDRFRISRAFGYLLGLLFPLLAVYILKGRRKSSLLFLGNLLVTFAMGILIPLSNARYAGFTFIGFIVALWLGSEEKELRGRQKSVFYALLLLQIAGSIVAVPKDISHAFSNAFRLKEVLRAVPAGEMVATDYFCLNGVAAYVAQPFYCLETNSPEYFLKWDQAMTRIDSKKNRYTRGADSLFRETGRSSFYLITTSPRKMLSQTDTGLLKTLNVDLITQREGAIEKYSNIYLYRISR
jgi:hypothetical protein